MTNDAAPSRTQSLDELNSNFAIPGVLGFAMRGELTLAEITIPAAAATLALEGAHLIHWQPAGERSVLFLSNRTAFTRGKAIRGGIPVIFPWFGERSDAVSPAPANAPKSSSHGFARISPWRLSFAALAGEEFHLSLSLAPTGETRGLGFAGFRAVCQIILGRRLVMRLTIANDGPEPMRYEEAFHTYFAVSDVGSVRLRGVENLDYLDKTEGMRRRHEGSGPLTLKRTTDRVYLASAGPLAIEDPHWARAIHLRKTNSRSTVVWNPWAELARTLPDMEPEGWRGMLCVESANVGVEAITLAPGEAHTLEAEVTVAPLEPAPRAAVDKEA